jgi:transposase
MAGFVAVTDRGQSTLLPECLDDWVDESNPIRVIDAFIDALDLRKLRFEGVDPAETGRPAYHPCVHLKLYIYGYLNHVQSSRRLEREASRNLEVLWLLGRLAPDHKTIADFRKDNGPAIKKVRAQFVELCRKMELLAKASVAIDGSKFKAVNNRDKNFTKAKVERRRTQLEQISLTDPDSRSMATSSRGSGVVGYNVQTAVVTENHLIVAHEVSNVGSDRSQLTNMGKAAKEAIGTETLEAVADRGYFNGEEIKTCIDAGITVTLPKPMTSSANAEGRFGKEDFVYLADENVYRCPVCIRRAGSPAGTFRMPSQHFFSIRPPGRDWRALTPQVPTFPHNQDPIETCARGPGRRSMGRYPEPGIHIPAMDLGLVGYVP